MVDKEQTISEFFKENQEIIAGIGFFVALAELSKSYVAIPAWAHGLSFLFLGLAIFLVIELIRKSPKEVTDSLYLFRAFFILTIFIFALYWFVINLDMVVYVLLGCIAGFIIAAILLGYKRLRFGKKWKLHI